MRCSLPFGCLLIWFASLSVSAAGQNAPLQWKPWSGDTLQQARQEKRFLILDLQAVWCHWCHAMAETTYNDPKVIALRKSRYLTVRVDQDANPDLSSRYGDWGWFR